MSDPRIITANSLYSLSVVFGPSGTVFGFLFRSAAAAEAAYKKLNEARQMPVHGGTHVEIADDFGQRASFTSNSIHGVLFEDIEQGGEAGIERGLNQARAQARGNTRASQDPVLRAAGMMHPANGGGMIGGGRG